jgi:hypothetical protein
MTDLMRLRTDLKLRQHNLEKQARSNKGALNRVKGLGLFGIGSIAWMIAASNPAVAGIVGVAGLINYYIAASKEVEKTKEFRPLLSSKSFLDLAQSFDRESEHQSPLATVEDDALYLDDQDLGEWLLLRTAMPQVVEFLSAIPAESHDEVLDLASIEAYRLHGYMYRDAPSVRHQMKLESVGRHALQVVATDHGYLLGEAQNASETAAVEPPGNVSPPSPTVGNDTKIGAIAVPATVVENESEPIPQLSPKTVPWLTTAWDVVLGNPMESRAFFGGQRTGKSYFCAALTNEIKKRHNTRIFHLNLHSFGDEDGYYWKHCEQSIAVDLSMMDGHQAKVVIQSATRIVEEFYRTPNAILVVDEWTIIGAVNSRYRQMLEPLIGFVADKIAVLTSSGKKRGQAIWTISPNFVAANLTQNAKAIKGLNLCYLSVTPGKKIDWNGQAIGASLELWNQLNVNYTIAPLPFVGEFEGDRIACIDAEWIPLGTFPKLEPDSTKLERLIEVEADNVPREEELDYESDDPIFDLISEIPDRDRREAFTIAYQWATKRISEGKPMDKDAFLARARNDRNCPYLKEHRESIWDELIGLIS